MLFPFGKPLSKHLFYVQEQPRAGKTEPTDWPDLGHLALVLEGGVGHIQNMQLEKGGRGVFSHQLLQGSAH